jgi:hypothetical protein
LILHGIIRYEVIHYGVEVHIYVCNFVLMLGHAVPN